MDELTAAILAHEEVARYLSGSHGLSGAAARERVITYLEELRTTQRYELYRALEYPLYPILRKIERVGENVEMDGQKAYRASLLDLLAVANIERPISEEYMRDILSGGAYPEFLTDESEEDYFFYVPAE